RVYIKDNESIVNEDIVAWYTLSFAHDPEVEDYPVLNSHVVSFKLTPSAFFDLNPAVDVNPNNALVCCGGDSDTCHVDPQTCDEGCTGAALQVKTKKVEVKGAKQVEKNKVPVIAPQNNKVPVLSNKIGMIKAGINKVAATTNEQKSTTISVENKLPVLNAMKNCGCKNRTA